MSGPASPDLGQHRQHLGRRWRRVTRRLRGPRRDALTGLGSREVLTGAGVDRVAAAVADDHVVALLVLDLDGFKLLNDTAGHHAGDRVLVEVAHRLRRTTSSDDLLVRLGGDEFAVLTGPLESAEQATALAQRIVDSLVELVAVDELLLSPAGCVGVATLGRDGDTLPELLLAADQAMYLAKQSGGSHWRAASSPDDRDAGAGTRLLLDLRSADLADQLVVHYQPQVDARTGCVTGFEALVRWQHPELGLLAPARFIPLAERSGLIAQITATVLDRALGDLGELRRLAPGARLSINVPRRLVLARGLVEGLDAQVSRRGHHPRDLVLEITEPVARASTEAHDMFRLLGEHGFRVSIRGFGTASSSLTALWSNPAVREVKIDPTIIARLDDDAESERLVRALVSATHGLGIRVVAEGVESLAVLERLRQLECDTLQGFHVGAPTDLDGIRAWFASRGLDPDAGNREDGVAGSGTQRRLKRLRRPADDLGGSVSTRTTTPIPTKERPCPC